MSGGQIVSNPRWRLTAAVVLYSFAMAYLEAAVVVYLRSAIGVPTGRIFPIDLSPAAMPYGWIEVGREGATLVMIGAVAWIAGRSSLERLALGGSDLRSLGHRLLRLAVGLLRLAAERAHLGPPLPDPGSLGRPGLGADRGQRGRHRLRPPARAPAGRTAAWHLDW